METSHNLAHPSLGEPKRELAETLWGALHCSTSPQGFVYARIVTGRDLGLLCMYPKQDVHDLVCVRDNYQPILLPSQPDDIHHLGLGLASLVSFGQDGHLCATNGWFKGALGGQPTTSE